MHPAVHITVTSVVLVAVQPQLPRPVGATTGRSGTQPLKVDLGHSAGVVIRHLGVYLPSANRGQIPYPLPHCGKRLLAGAAPVGSFGDSDRPETAGKDHQPSPPLRHTVILAVDHIECDVVAILT